jgi:UDP-N-acetylmuramoyl-tripeptide--D-alanyl-D-alanine ligase
MMSSPFWNPETLARASRGAWRRPMDETRTMYGVSIDTRTLRPGQVYVALRGERFDGHAFVSQAIEAGAPAIMVSDESAADAAPDGIGALLVPDTATALVDLSHAYRDELSGLRIVGITGSSGKTTTRRLLHAALSAEMRGSASIRNYNNDIGLPLTILAAEPDDDYLIAEVGTNAPGEIAMLSRLLRPHIGLITSIGRSHLEGLGDLAGVCQEKLDLLRCLEPGGLGIVPADAPLISEIMASDGQLTSTRIRTFGRAASADLQLLECEQRIDGVQLRATDGLRASLRLLGTHNANNLLGALLAARAVGIEDAAALEAMSRVEPGDMRLCPDTYGGINVLNDCYNANPESLASVLDTFFAVAASDRPGTIILGDMLELGSHAVEAHQEAGQRLADEIAAGKRVDRIVLVGPLMREAATVLEDEGHGSRVTWLESLDDKSVKKIVAEMKRDDQVLLKGSRGMELEHIAHRLAKRAPAGVT